MPAAQSLKSKEYETIYILRSDVDPDTAEKVQGRVAEVVARDHGKLVKVETWGRRRLAYPVAKQKKGVYVYVKYVGKGGLVQELERNLQLQDSVLKFQTIQTLHEVDVTSLEVDPEEVKFQRLELPPEDEREESREKALGLVETSSEPSRGSRHEGAREEEFQEPSDAAEAETEEARPENKEEGEG